MMMNQIRPIAQSPTLLHGPMAVLSRPILLLTVEQVQ